MELRKQQEQEHANKLKGLLEASSDEEMALSNKKFYKIARGSRNYMKKWLITEISRGKKNILDYCCGEGEMAIFTAQNGANATGVDISDVSIKSAEKKAIAQSPANKPNFLVMDAENLTFSDNSFDVIICSGVLHHLDIERAYAELSRVLKPDGQVICNEPLAYNPLIQLYRYLTPKLRTDWESKHILTKKSIYLSKKYFGKIETRFYHLTTILAVPFRKTRFFSFILSIPEAIDWILLKLPLIKWLSWQIIFILSKPKK
ncbi:MAG: class I SAM-dependent methyltransferase [Patescibacteria group bacterium]